MISIADGMRFGVGIMFDMLIVIFVFVLFNLLMDKIDD